MIKKIFFLFFLAASLKSPLEAQKSFTSVKKNTFLQISTLPGWGSEEKARLMMDLIKNNHLQKCVEIGVFAGRSLLPIAKALAFLGKGKVYGIDPWDPEESTKGLSPNSPHYLWWHTLDYKSLFEITLSLIEKNKLKNYCEIIKAPAETAETLFEKESLDFIHYDGNHSENLSFEVITLFFSKLKMGGYFLLNDPTWNSMKKSLVFLLERSDLISSFSSNAPYLLFCKNKEKVQRASQLMKE